MTKIKPKFNGSAADLWLIHGRYYDLSSYVQQHPGGAHMILLGKGKDCTELFESVHSTAKIDVARLLKRYEVAYGAAEIDESPFDWQHRGFYKDLSQRVQGYFKERQMSSKAPISFWAWVIPTVIAWIGAFGLWLATAHPLIAAVTGFLGISLGFSVFHAASHAAISENPQVNKWLTFLWGDFHFFHYSLWMHHHVYAHHSYTGVHRKDPDIGNAAILVRKHEKSKVRPAHRFQKYTTLPFLTIVPGQWLGQCLQYSTALLTGRLFGMKVKKYIDRNDIKISSLILFISVSLHLALPFAIHGWTFLPSLLVYVGVLNLVYWIIVFPNHDTEFSRHSPKVARDWGEQQVSASLSFYQPRWLSQLNGGMNFQIEHHLFPSIAPYHYQAIQPIVQTCCNDYGIYYPYAKSWTDSLRSHLRFLDKMSKSGLASNRPKPKPVDAQIIPD